MILQENNLPDDFFITNLEYPGTGSNIILLGVERQSYVHAHLLSDLLIKLNPQLIFTQISPDEPYFIRKPQDFNPEDHENYAVLTFRTMQFQGYNMYWRYFMKQKFDPDFYVNPGPHYLVDTMILK